MTASDIRDRRRALRKVRWTTSLGGLPARVLAQVCAYFVIRSMSIDIKLMTKYARAPGSSPGSLSSVLSGKSFSK